MSNKIKEFLNSLTIQEFIELKKEVEKITLEFDTSKSTDKNSIGFNDCYNTFSLPPLNQNKCPRCGINMENLSHYVCTQYGCPTGLGGITC